MVKGEITYKTENTTNTVTYLQYSTRMILTLTNSVTSQMGLNAVVNRLILFKNLFKLS